MGSIFPGIKQDAKLYGKILRHFPYDSAWFGLVI